MECKGRALYNLLRLTAGEPGAPTVPSHLIADYRSMSEETIFRSLAQLGLPVTKENFSFYAEGCEDPEELTDCLSPEDFDPKLEEQAYLLLFELWRRKLPGKQSLSVFFDELDFLISEFDAGVGIEEEKWQTLLSRLGDILHQNTDGSEEPKQVFAALSLYAAHAIDTFLYDYILELLEERQELGAAFLIETFEEYVPDKKWFSLLRAHLLAASGIESWSGLIGTVLEEESPERPFLEEVLLFLTSQDDSDLFFECLRQLIPLTEVEEEMQEWLRSALLFSSDRKKPFIETLLAERASFPPSARIGESDKAALNALLIEA